MSNMRLFYNLKLRNKFLAGFLIIFIPVSIIGGGIMHSVLQRHFESVVETELNRSMSSLQSLVRESAVVSIKNHLRSIVKMNLKTADYFWHMHLNGNLTRQEAESKIHALLLQQTIGKTGYICGINSSGVVSVHPDSGMVGSNIAGYGFVKKMITGKDGYIEYNWKNPEETSEREKAMYIGWFKPLDLILGASAYKSEFSELVDIDDFRESIKGFKIGKTGYSFVIDIHGEQVVHPILNTVDLKGRASNETFFFQELIMSKSGRLDYSWQNPGETRPRKKIVLFSHLPEYDWIIASTAYYDEVYQHMGIFKRVVITSLLIGFLLNLIIISQISLSVTRPLKLMQRKFSEGAKGDFTTRMDYDAKDEVGRLADHFNFFMKNLHSFNTIIQTEIDERQKVEHKLAASKHRLELALEVNTTVVWEWNLSTDKLLVEEKSFLKLGYTYNYMNDSGSNIVRKLLHPDDYGRFKKALNDHLEGRTESLNMEYRLRTAKDEWAWRYARARKIDDDKNNNECRLLGMSIDISYRKQAEKEIQFSREKYKQLYENAPVGLFRISVDNGRMLECNDNFANAMGYQDREQALSKFFACEHFCDLQDLRFYMRLIGEKDQLSNMEATFQKKNSEKVIFHGALKYFKENGYIEGAAADITEKKIAENALKDSEKLFHDVVDSSPVGISIVRNNRIVFMNPAQKKIMGDPPESFRISCLNVISEDQSTFERFINSLTALTPQHGETEMRFYPYEKKELSHVNIRTNLVDYLGKKAILINMVNITKSKELERLIHIREKMVSLGHVATGIAHEIRNPLSGISLILKGVEETFEEPENHEEVRELIRQAQKASDKIALVVKRVLDFSKPTQLTCELSDINKAVHEAVAFTETSLRKAGILLGTTLGENLPAIFYDYQYMSQVIINLVTNSLEAMRDYDGLKYISIMTDANNKEVILRVSDTGPGIAEDILDKIFEPYFTTRSSGSGIGLSLCQRIVADHGGTITALFLEPSGSEFVIRLPFGRKELE